MTARDGTTYGWKCSQWGIFQARQASLGQSQRPALSHCSWTRAGLLTLTQWSLVSRTRSPKCFWVSSSGTCLLTVDEGTAPLTGLGLYWVGQKVHSGFFIGCCRKTQMNLLADTIVGGLDSIFYPVGVGSVVLVITTPPPPNQYVCSLAGALPLMPRSNLFALGQLPLPMDEFFGENL